jgi:hypothetical protein
MTMKNTLQIQAVDQRHASEARASRRLRSFPQIEHNYQSSQLQDTCGTPAKFHRPAFFEISNRYFADEAAHSFLVDTAVFGALILTTLLPIVNSVQAVATLLHTVGVL